MNMLPCPHCGKPGITALRHACLGPLARATCSQCGQKVGIPVWSIVMMLPMLIALVVALEYDVSSTLGVWIAAVGVAITGLLWITYVPLIKR